MLKQIFFKEAVQDRAEERWIGTPEISRVEVSSEEALHPIEHALTGTGEGWMARDPGEQTIRLTFESPENLSRIRLRFREEDRPRSQEFVLSWLPEQGGRAREIVRQQYNFSPPWTVEESEEYAVNLKGVRSLQLTITPDRSDPTAKASLARWQIG